MVSATAAAEEYAHQDWLFRVSVAQRVRHWSYQIELGQSAELSLPSDGVSPVSAQGQLGLGSTYFAGKGNNSDPAAASFRQGFLRYNFTPLSDSVRIGRFEFIDGHVIATRSPTLTWLQVNRIAHRIVGNFGFSNGQRSFDGVEGNMGDNAWDLTAMTGRAAQGVFNMNANPELNVDIQYVSYTRSIAGHHVIHSDGAIAAEGGVRFDSLRTTPWLRGRLLPFNGRPQQQRRRA